MKSKHISEIIPAGWKVDKMKLEVKYRSIEEVQALIWEISNDSRVITSYESRKITECAKNYKIELKGGMVYIGIGKNSHQDNWKDNQKSMILEYNPFKVNPFKEIEYLEHITMMDKLRIGVMRFDMAYDIYTHITTLEMDKRHGNEKYGIFGSNEVETIYRGDKGHNHVKLYNKAKELNKKILEESISEDGEVIENKLKVIGDCTRFEITIEISPGMRGMLMQFVYWDFKECVNLPKIRPKQSKDKITEEIINIGGNDAIKLFAIHNGLEKLITNNNTRKKYIEMYQDIKNKPLGCESNDLLNALSNFNINELNDTISDYITSTFKGKKLVPVELDF